MIPFEQSAANKTAERRQIVIHKLSKEAALNVPEFTVELSSTHGSEIGR